MRNLSRILPTLGLTLILFSAASAMPEPEASYRITISASNTRLLHVEARFNAKSDIIGMNPYGAQQFPAGWAEFVRALRAFDKAGRPINIEGLGRAQWKLNVRPGQPVRLNYDVLLDHESHKWAAGIDGVAFVRNWGIYATGRTYLITNESATGPVNVSFQLPKGWHVTAPWKPRKGSANSFAANDLDDLVDSMIFAGTHKEFVVDRNGFQLWFALGGDELLADETLYRSLANGVMDHYIKLMGGPPKPPAKTPFSRAVVILNPGEQTDGEVIGNNICIIVGSKSDPTSELFAKFIFAHEFFHLWNGKSIMPKDTTDEWFKEGFTNIYAMKALNRIGAITEAELFGALDGLFYKRYSTDSAYGNASMREVAAGDEKHKHWGLIYGGGMFVGICQDIRIRNATQNKKSLDDLMRDYYKRLARTDKTYTTADLQSSVTALSGEDQSDFFKRHVFGVERVPIESCLSNAGLTASVENNRLIIKRKPDASLLENSIRSGVLGK